MAGSGSSEVRTSIFSGENYELWRIKMATIFKSHGLWKLVEKGVATSDSKKKAEGSLEEEDDEKTVAAYMQDAKALGIIQSAVLDQIFPQIANVDSANMAWDLLYGEYHGGDQWAEAIESLDYGNPGSEKTFGMKQRPDGDIEIDENFWEEEFHIPTCPKCNGVLKPDVIFFGDNVPKDRAEKTIQAAKECDAFLVLGSSLMTMSAYRLVRAAHEAGAATAIVNVGVTRADDIVPLKINARLGEILPRVLDMGSLGVPAIG